MVWWCSSTDGYGCGLDCDYGLGLAVVMITSIDSATKVYDSRRYERKSMVELS